MNVANIMQISYGYEIQEKNDPFVGLANEATHHFTLSTTPGTFLVNTIPICKSNNALFSQLISVAFQCDIFRIGSLEQSSSEQRKSGGRRYTRWWNSRTTTSNGE